MSDYSIKVEGLGKKYKIGEQILDSSYASLRDELAKMVRAGLKRLRSNNGASSNCSDNESAIWACKDISFSVKQGEVLAFIGRNGAGKSTLLKLLSRITEPTEGQATIRGRVGSLLEIGTGFHPELTGRENIYLNGAILGMKRSEINSKFDAIVDFAEVETFLDTPVKRYSSGMLVRLGFAVAAHLEPEILIVDEVLAVGDLAFQQKCMRHMKKLTETGMTIIIVSHNMGAIQTACNRAILLDKGMIVDEGETVNVIESFRNLLEMSHDSQDMIGKNKDGSDAEVLFKSVELVNEEGIPRRDYNFGEKAKIKIDLFADHRIENPMIAFRILRPDGVIVCNFNNWYDNFKLDYLEGDCTIEGWLPPFRIIPGYYMIDVYVWYWGAKIAGDIEKARPIAYQEFGHFRIIGPPIDDHEVFQPCAEKWVFTRGDHRIEHKDINPDSIYKAFDVKQEL